ncbi:hypothetical protein [Natrinema ejinorense]|uniref:hypothetical protein n=1 Tax=Natrinema ejinorense TaxID=373386 RepID=UPI001475FCC7|nr:hypothetical protein [Natrinema ejinorense]
MSEIRLMLFGIAVILVSGFRILSGLIHQWTGLTPNNELAQFGLIAGLIITLLGFLYGIFADAVQGT